MASLLREPTGYNFRWKNRSNRGLWEHIGNHLRHKCRLHARRCLWILRGTINQVPQRIGHHKLFELWNHCWHLFLPLRCHVHNRVVPFFWKKSRLPTRRGLNVCRTFPARLPNGLIHRRIERLRVSYYSGFHHVPALIVFLNTHTLAKSSSLRGMCHRCLFYRAQESGESAHRTRL